MFGSSGMWKTISIMFVLATFIFFSALTATAGLDCEKQKDRYKGKTMTHFKPD